MKKKGKIIKLLSGKKHQDKVEAKKLKMISSDLEEINEILENYLKKDKKKKEKSVFNEGIIKNKNEDNEQ